MSMSKRRKREADFEVREKEEKESNEKEKAPETRVVKPGEVSMKKTVLYSVVVAAIFFGVGFLVNPAITGYSIVSSETNDQLIFISPPGCTNCVELEPMAKEVANTLGIPFVKTGFAQQIQNPGFVLIYDDVLTISGMEDEYSLKAQVCMLTGNEDICNRVKELEPEQTPEQPPAPDVPKSDKPEVELFVMSFCPYGVQAESAMKPVVDLLGDKADINVKFIVNVGGDTPDSVQSLHGPPEAMEDLRQTCVRENYDYTTFWNYVSQINENCYSIYRDSEAMDACWKAAAEKAGIDVSSVESCLETSSVNIIKQDEATANGYGVTGSPTIVINGQRVSPARTPEGFKQAICNAFTTPPEECQQALEGGSEQQPTGGCE